MNKILTCYFSATGTTKNVAENINKIISGDLFEIIPEEKYTNEDLDWNDEKSRTTLEKENPNIRPKILKQIDNIDNYQKIIVGFPVWWYKEPNIIDTFFENNNLENKEVYVFVTSGGSGVTDSLNSLKEKYPKVNFKSGKRLSMNITKEEIDNWLIGE